MEMPLIIPNLFPIIDIPIFLVHFVGKSIPIQINHSQQSVAFGTVVVKISANATGRSSHYWIKADSKSTAQTPASALGGSECCSVVSFRLKVGGYACAIKGLHNSI